MNEHILLHANIYLKKYIYVDTKSKARLQFGV